MPTVLSWDYVGGHRDDPDKPVPQRARCGDIGIDDIFGEGSIGI